MKYVIFSAVEFLDKELKTKVSDKATKKFGEKPSYAKNLWVLQEYKKQGGKVKYSGKKPSNKSIKKEIGASVEVDASAYAVKKITLLDFLGDETIEKNSLLAALGKEIESSEGVSSEPVEEEDELEKEIEYLNKRIDWANDRINSVYNSLTEMFYNHLNGHLPRINSVEQYEKALKALGLDKEYKVEKKTLYASSDDKTGTEKIVLVPVAE